MKTLNSPIRAWAMIVFLSSLLVVPCFLKRSAAMGKAQNLNPAGDLSQIAIDGGSVECIIGPPDSSKGAPGWGWANKLTPKSYPATLRSITIGFNRGGLSLDVKSDDLY